MLQSIPLRVLRLITRLNIGGPSIQAITLSERLTPRGFTTRLVHGSLGAQNSVLGGGRYDGLAESLGSKVPAPGIGFFERWLSAWVALCIVTGIGLGQWFPGPVKAMGELQIARVNLPVGALI